MGINFDGLNPEMKAKLEKLTDDKRITKQEFDSLTPEEQAALTSALGGVAPTDKTDVVLKTVKKEQPKQAEQPKQEEKGWFDSAVDWVKDHAMPLAVGAAALAGGTALVVAGVVSAPVAIVAGAGALLLTSCSSDEPTPIDLPDVNINNNIGVTITQNSSIDDLINYIDKKWDVHNKTMQEILAVLNSIKGDTNIMKAGMEKIFMALVEMGVKIDDLYNMMDVKGDQIINLLKENNTYQEQILNVLSKGNGEIKDMLGLILNAVREGNQIGTNNGKILNQILDALKNPDTSSSDNVVALLKQILESITNLTQDNKDMHVENQKVLNAILENINDLKVVINSGNAEANELLKSILNAVNTGNNIGTNNGKVLVEILNALKNPDNASNDTVIALLKQILDKIENISSGGGDVDGTTKALLLDILHAIQNMNADMKVGFQAILDKMDGLSQAGKADLSAILKAIQENTEKVEQGNQTAKENQAILQRILDMLGKIMPLLEGLGDKGDTIINLIKDITVGGAGGTVTIDLSKIEEMLAQLLEQSKKNGNTLDEINAKLDVIAVSVEGVKLALDGLTNLTAEFKAEVGAKLDAILAKIGSGHCDCNVSLEVIIKRLDTIIENLKNDTNHEGILDDLDDLLG